MRLPPSIKPARAPASNLNLVCNTWPIKLRNQWPYSARNDSKTIGRLLNIGRVYVQAGIDGNCRVAFAHLYQDKTADSAADFMEKVVAETLG